MYPYLLKTATVVTSLFFLVMATSCEKIDFIPAPTPQQPKPVEPATDPDHPPTVTIIANNINKDTLLYLVNTARAKGCNCGGTIMPPVPPVKWNDLLEYASVAHSKDMYDKGYFDHISLDGKNPGQRIESVGYNWWYYAENIAKGPSTEVVVITGWLNSPGHCKNLMDAKFKEMGVGKYGSYWTQSFASTTK
ncbi:uncharacterized protein YkwD [Chitinophaga skermanii]|uniref:Uncharacterized protein YkwD n=1 Tax=Chitinophaga skermanii TaxID=331697 RepID=A0A327QAN1_9BACT|nr:CAP domain-containing protein [Chitinophaga skermanii]RAJ01490.1 uncharacterized protein YkwD [Chitinophaga skermanii]